MHLEYGIPYQQYSAMFLRFIVFWVWWNLRGAASAEGFTEKSFQKFAEIQKALRPGRKEASEKTPATQKTPKVRAKAKSRSKAKKKTA